MRDKIRDISTKTPPSIIKYMTECFKKKGTAKLYPYQSEFLKLFRPIKNPKWRWWKFWIKKWIPRDFNKERPIEFKIIKGAGKV
jgi:hypothetical protein